MAATDGEDVERLRAGIIDTRRSPHFRLQTVPISAVRMGEGFWQPRMTANVRAGMPTFLGAMEEHGVVDNFRRLSGRTDVPFRPASYMSESDLYKWLEAVGLALQSEDLPDLRKTAEAVIDEVAAAQAEDGYLYVADPPPSERFSRLEGSHELYCAGHLMQAGIAYYRATGERKLLEVGVAFADYLTEQFGPGKREQTDGHPEVELALTELYRTTGERRYLDLAGFLLGRSQALRGLPPIAQRPALVDHCVRSGYICSGGADWYAETGDEMMWSNLLRLWDDLVTGKIYITGGVGARHASEAFGEPYELPNARAYAETCAQIAHVMWAWRMLLVTGEGRFADVIEQILYNGFLSGVSLDGDEYFYMNPLASDGGYQRQPWFGTNCCPPNIHRMLAGLPGYIFSTSSEGLWVHLYDTCEATLTAPGGSPVALSIDARYPWDGDIEITLTPDEPEEFALLLRIPGWAEGAAVSVKGEAFAALPQPGDRERSLPAATAQPGTYLALRRCWEAGDTVRLELPLPIRVMQSHPRVAENRGCVALQRGPVVYCFESTDNPEAPVADLALALDPQDAAGGFRAQWQPDLLGGVTVLRGAGVAASRPPSEYPLYRPRGTGPEASRARDKEQATAIPYYAWANRGDSAMRVWVPVASDSSR